MVVFKERVIDQVSDIITELLAHKKSDIYQYFDESKHKEVDKAILTLANIRAIIIKEENGEEVIYPYRNYDEDDIYEQNRLQKPLYFLRYLLNIKDTNGYIYRNKLDFVFEVSYPNSLYMKLNEQMIYIIYVPNNDIANINLVMNALDKEENIDGTNVKRIILTDNDKDIDQINIHGVLNIFSVSQNGKVKILK